MSEFRPWESAYWVGKPLREVPFSTRTADPLLAPWSFLRLVPKSIKDRYEAFYAAWGRKLRRDRLVREKARVARDLTVRRQLEWVCLYEAVKKNAYFAAHPEAARAVFTDWIRNTEEVRSPGGEALHRRCVGAFEKWFDQIDPARIMYRRNRWFLTLGQLNHLSDPPKPRQVSQAVVRRVIEMSKANPDLSCRRTAQRIRAKGMRVSHATVQRILENPESYKTRCQERTLRNRAYQYAEERVWREAQNEALALYSRGWGQPTLSQSSRTL